MKHIVNGDSAASSIAKAFEIPMTDIMILRDVLSCGPLEEFLHAGHWRQLRDSYWSEDILRDRVSRVEGDLYIQFDRLIDAQALTLWIGCSLSDQLLLVFLVRVLDNYNIDSNKLEILQYSKLEKKHGSLICGLGELSPEEVASCKPKAFRLDGEQVEFCRDVWKSLIATTPEQLMGLLSQSQAPLPFLHAALQNLFYRFPDEKLGLSYFDALLLRYVKEQGPEAQKIIGFTMGHDMFDQGSPHMLDVVGDGYLFNRLMSMSRWEFPLVKANAQDKSMKDTKVELTQIGVQILEGEQNNIELNGIDDWVGGIRISSKSGKLWWREGKKLIADNR